MDEGLTPYEEIALMAHYDQRHRDEYDGDYLKALRALKEPPINHLDDRRRRALAIYIEELEKHLSNRYTPGGFMMVGWILGYEAARTISQSIYKEGKEPQGSEHQDGQEGALLQGLPRTHRQGGALL
jgi:hypothetical protein